MRVLAVMGAGAKIGVLVGAIDRLIAAGEARSFDAVVGTSSGSLVGAAFAHWLAGNTRPWKDMHHLLLSTEGDLERRVYRKPRFGYLGMAYNLVRKGALWDHAPLRDTVREVIGTPPPNFRAVVTNMDTGEAEVAPGYPADLQASCTIPLTWPLVRRGANLYADGGLRDNAPVKHAVAMGADEVVCVLSRPLAMNVWLREHKLLAIDTLIRTMDVLMHNALVDDLKETTRRNGQDGYREVALTVVEPQEISGGTLDFSPEHQQRALRIGREAVATRWDTSV